MKTELIHSYSTASLSSVFSHAFDKAEDDRNGFSQSNCRIKSSSNLEAVRDWSKNNFKKKLLFKKLPILTWITQYTFGFFVADMIAGLTVGLTLLPQGIACASIAQVSPQVNDERRQGLRLNAYSIGTQLYNVGTPNSVYWYK